jgi:hypothetical protein
MDQTSWPGRIPARGQKQEGSPEHQQEKFRAMGNGKKLLENRQVTNKIMQ